MPLCACAQDFGLDFNLGLKKKIIKGLSIAVGFELRTQDMTTEMGQIDASFEMSYKPIDYFKFGAGYDFIDKYYPNITTWSPRHRANVFVTGILPIEDFELSLRERYQYTYRSMSGKIASKHEHILRSRLQAEYHIKAVHLTPYLNFEMYNDLANSFAIDKLKLNVGLTYTLKKKKSKFAHDFEFFYRYTAPIASDDEDFHMIALGYLFKF